MTNKQARRAPRRQKHLQAVILDATRKSLTTSKQQLATAQSKCLTVGADHEETVAARKAELAVIADAKKLLKDTPSGAVSQTYSLLQIQSRSDLAGAEVVTVVRRLAKQQHSEALAQLASRISPVLRFGSTGRDPFAKVKGLTQDMLRNLQKKKEAEADATEKAYCDEQIAKAEAKKAELEEDIGNMTSRIDKADARG